jgi:hypothetical protein
VAVGVEKKERVAPWEFGLLGMASMWKTAEPMTAGWSDAATALAETAAG